MLLSWKVGPGLGAGNCLIVKPASSTPLTALKLGELVRMAGIPAGVYQVIPGSGSVIGNGLASHMRIDKVAFTGSVPVGKQIMRAAADSNLKRTHLELGGKSPVIVLPDVDVDYAAKWCHMGIFLNCGENCCAGSRVFVHTSIADKFIAATIKLATDRAARLGDPQAEETLTGPCVDKNQFDTVLRYIARGKEQGATLAAGGNRVGTKGYFVQPTVFTNVRDDMDIAKEEIFGPVLVVLTFDDVADAVKRANASEFGLAAAVFTNDLRQAMTVSNELRAGTVWVNAYNMTDPGASFGGFKESGFGRDLGEAAFNNYTEVKTVTVNYGAKATPDVYCPPE